MRLRLIAPLALSLLVPATPAVASSLVAAPAAVSQQKKIHPLDALDARLAATPPKAADDYFDDPVGFAWDAFRCRLSPDQEAILRAMAAGERVTVKSGHKTGKSRAIGIAAWWWGHTRPRGRVVCTSSIDRQVRFIIWREIRGLWKDRQPGFDFPAPAELPGLGVQWADGRQIMGFTTRDAEGAAGFSSDQILYLIDEASGIKDKLFDAFEGNMAGGGQIALFSNPTQTVGYFYESHKPTSREFTKFTIRSDKTPNCIEGRMVIPGMATREWCEARRIAWGEESARYRVRVLGEFPDQADDTIISRKLMDAAVRRHGEGETVDTGPLVVGVDVARFGPDESVMTFARGRRLFDTIGEQGLDTHELADRVVREADARRNGFGVHVCIDTTGVGGGVADSLRHRNLAWLVVHDVVASEAATEPERHLNKRAELWYGMAEFLKDESAYDDPEATVSYLHGGELPEDEDLDLELGVARYKFDKKNRLQVESKDEMKKRLPDGRSPDRADAANLAVYGLNLVARGIASGSVGKVVHVDSTSSRSSGSRFGGGSRGFG